jgi:hypothetical protein
MENTKTIINDVAVNDESISSLEGFITWYMEEIDDEYDLENDENDDFTVLKNWCNENDHYILIEDNIVINLKIAKLTTEELNELKN